MPLIRDHDFHPREPTVRVFRHPPAGVLRADADALVVVAHYVTTDPNGGLVETAPSEDAPATRGPSWAGSSGRSSEASCWLSFGEFTHSARSMRPVGCRSSGCRLRTFRPSRAEPA